MFHILNLHLLNKFYYLFFLIINDALILKYLRFLFNYHFIFPYKNTIFNSDF